MASVEEPRRALFESLNDVNAEETAEGSNNIQVYLRMRPMAGRCMWHSIGGSDMKTLITKIPKEDISTLNNARSEYRFHFDGIFNENATQEDVFQTVALPVIDDALKGINGTIFAYGQTGTGKTYTITGSAEAFEMRGIIPRALARVFEFASSCQSADFTLAISYLEIYQDRGYDLLVRTERGGRNLEDLKRVYAIADETGQVFLRGLSVNPVRTEEEALSLLFVGDANRIVAETPLNDCSTRSHCIFTIWLASKDHDSRSTRRAKLHLVDLAGSERVKQSGTRPGDSVFQEACSINLSLHYLEQVIVALQQKAAGQATHIPYRNSLMTSVLKDSLGGNCKTRMIATVALELYAIYETINTCRFAQAVAQIKNVAEINEEEETSALIERLQKENERLRGQLQLAAAAQEEQTELTEEIKDACKDSIEKFLWAKEDEMDLPVSAARCLRTADFCFRLIREKFKNATTQEDEAGRCMRKDCLESLQKLQLHVEQRDAEIATLLGILHQRSDSTNNDHTNDPIRAVTRAAVEAVVKGPHFGFSAADDMNCNPPWHTGSEATALLKDRGRAFEILRRSARKMEFLEADSQRLHQLYVDAKKHEEAAAHAKAKIDQSKAKLEKIRVLKCLQKEEGVTEEIYAEDTPEEMSLLQELAGWRDEYIRSMDALGAAKRELKRVHMSVERSRQKLQKDFEKWVNTIAAQHIQCAEKLHHGENTAIENLESFSNNFSNITETQNLNVQLTPRCTSRELSSPWATPHREPQRVKMNEINNCEINNTERCDSTCTMPASANPLFNQASSSRSCTVTNSLVLAEDVFSSSKLLSLSSGCEYDEPEQDMNNTVANNSLKQTPRQNKKTNNLKKICSSISPALHNSDSREKKLQEQYTGNASADADIEAFYKAIGLSPQAPPEE